MIDLSNSNIWEIVNNKVSPTFIYLIGSAYDGPDARPVFVRTVDAVDRLYRAYIDYRFSFSPGLSSVTLPIPAAADGIVSVSSPYITNYRLSGSTSLQFDPTLASGECTIRYFLKPDSRGYLPAAARLLFGAGASGLVLIRIPGIQASGQIGNIVVRARNSGSLYNGAIVEIDDRSINFTGLDGVKRSFPIDGPIWKVLQTLRYESDFPVYIDYDITNPPSTLPTGSCGLSGGITASYSEDALVYTMLQCQMPWPGVVTPAGGVTRRAALAIWMMNEDPSMFKCFSFRLPQIDAAAYKTVTVGESIVFGEDPTVGSGRHRSLWEFSMTDGLVYESGGVSLPDGTTSTDMDTAIRIRVADTNCPDLSYNVMRNYKGIVDSGETWRWTFTGDNRRRADSARQFIWFANNKWYVPDWAEVDPEIRLLYTCYPRDYEMTMALGIQNATGGALIRDPSGNPLVWDYPRYQVRHWGFYGLFLSHRRLMLGVGVIAYTYTTTPSLVRYNLALLYRVGNDFRYVDYLPGGFGQPTTLSVSMSRVVSRGSYRFTAGSVSIDPGIDVAADPGADYVRIKVVSGSYGLQPARCGVVWAVDSISTGYGVPPLEYADSDVLEFPSKCKLSVSGIYSNVSFMVRGRNTRFSRDSTQGHWSRLVSGTTKSAYRYWQIRVLFSGANSFLDKLVVTPTFI